MYRILIIFSCIILTLSQCPPCDILKVNRTHFGNCLVCKGLESKRIFEFPGYDGWYNNLGKPDSGAIDRPLLRRGPAAYEDGTYLPAGSNRPNPFEISDKLFKASDQPTKSKTGKNVLLVFYGEQVLQEILDVEKPACPPEYLNIPIPENHKYRISTGHTQMPFLRSRFDQKTGQNPSNPRQQLNGITPYIDGGVIYGTSKQWSDELRIDNDGTINPDGELASSSEGFPEFNTNGLPMVNIPPPFHHNDMINKHELLKANRFFKLGSLRGNENPFVLTFNVLWFRWHNYLARNIKSSQSEWSSDRIFNEARKWVIATQQHITLNEWLPNWVNKSKIPEYNGYDPSVDPQIDQLFATAAGRFGDTLVPSSVYFRDYGRNGCAITSSNNMRKSLVRTCNSYWRPENPILHFYDENKTEYIGIDRLLMGMAYQICEEEDYKVVDDLRQSFYGPLHFPRRDLMALNIQRGRDHGLPDFNSARKAFRLDTINSFDHFGVKDQQINNDLIELYNNDTNNIDVWVGGILETKNGTGELFEKIIIDQFRRIRDGDRFWFENTNNNLFTEEEIINIKKINLANIIAAVTQMDDKDLQKTAAFRVPTDLKDVHPNCANIVKKDSVCSGIKCIHLPLPQEEEPCTEGGTYDYFKTSELSFIVSLSVLIVVIIAIYCFIYLLIKIKRGAVKPRGPKPMNLEENTHQAREWLSPKDSRPILIHFNRNKRTIEVSSTQGIHFRSIDCSNQLIIKKTSDEPILLILRSEHGYDLVLMFDTDFVRRSVHNHLKSFFNELAIKEVTEVSIIYKEAVDEIITQEKREQQLEKFVRVLMAQAFKVDINKSEIASVSNKEEDIIKMKLSLYEFAKIMNMDPNSDFLKLIFQMVDKQQNKCISFREFLEFFAIFSDGTPTQKAKLIFKIYDIDNKDELTMDSFKEMIKSLLQNIQGTVHTDDLNGLVKTMLTKCGLERQEKLSSDDFVNLLGNKLEMLNDVNLKIRGESRAKKVRRDINSIYGNMVEIQEVFNERHVKIEKPQSRNSIALPIIRYIQKYCKEIFWMTLYTSIILAIFFQNIYDLAVEKEHTGLRRIAGYGVAVSRASATVMMITFSSLLVTMCRNLITILRDTLANKYFPFDSSVEIHKYIAYWALFFSILHILGHTVNFYHISTQTPDDLSCLFRNNFHASHELPTFAYWLWGTMAGVTGVILTVIGAIIYIFALPFVRRKLFNYFWYAHSLYPLFFIFTALHGSGRVIKNQIFYEYFIIPAILYTIDRIISISRRKIELSVVRARVLPSNVTALEISKPPGFEYKSGQWLTIACLGLNSREFHPFTISSSPDESIVSVHIRSVGPWTNNLREIYQKANDEDTPLPKIYLDGPFGEGHQDWYKYDVSILIGGGIGVTPFASILKDIAFKSQVKQVHIKKVYFLWVSRTQKEFEWLVQILSDIEKKDKSGVINTHIFITQFSDKYDIRTVLLHIFERNFQKTSNRSLFTNLSAVTHFGRPNFKTMFKTVQMLHSNDVTEIGVFSCGGPMMIKSIDEACIAANKSARDIPILEHHFKTF